MRRWLTAALGAVVLGFGLPVVIPAAPASAEAPQPGDATAFPTAVGGDVQLGEGVAHPDGSFWALDHGSIPGLVRVSPDNVWSRVDIAGVLADTHLTVATDGNLWLSRLSGDVVVRVTPTGTVTSFPDP